jgi:hypothetical protein
MCNITHVLRKHGKMYRKLGLRKRILWVKDEDKEESIRRRISTEIFHLSMEIKRKEIRKLARGEERQNEKENH